MQWQNEFLTFSPLVILCSVAILAAHLLSLLQSSKRITEPNNWEVTQPT